MDKNLIQRIISGGVYGLLIFLCTTHLGSVYLKEFFNINVKQEYLYLSLIVFLIIVGAWEAIRIMKFGDSWWKWLVYPIGFLVFYKFAARFLNHDFYFLFNLQEILGILLIAIASFTLFKYPNELYHDNGKLIFIIIYVFLSFYFALVIPYFDYSKVNCSGSMFGKHKMAPNISPKKTWAGFAGGVICTLVLGFFIEKYMPEMRGNWILVGLLVSVAAPIGDLVESQLKRTFGVKDSGNIIPGHGGVLDRLDSFIICAPVVYLYFVLEKLF